MVGGTGGEGIGEGEGAGGGLPHASVASAELRGALASMDAEQLSHCLKCSRDWNSTAHHSLSAQRLLHALFKAKPAAEAGPDTLIQEWNGIGRNPRRWGDRAHAVDARLAHLQWLLQQPQLLFVRLCMPPAERHLHALPLRVRRGGAVPAVACQHHCLQHRVRR